MLNFFPIPENLKKKKNLLINVVATRRQKRLCLIHHTIIKRTIYLQFVSKTTTVLNVINVLLFSYREEKVILKKKMR